MSRTGREALIGDLTEAAVHYCTTEGIRGRGTIILAATTDHARIAEDIGSIRLCCPPDGPAAVGVAGALGTSLLTAHRFDPAIRSAAMIPCLPSILEAAERVFLEVAEYDRRLAPPGISTMDWGTAFCCRDGVPDLIYDRASEPFVVVLFGETPMDVVNEIIMLFRRSTNIEL